MLWTSKQARDRPLELAWRYMVSADVRRVLAIPSGFRWSEKEFRLWMQRRTALVVERNREVVGFIVFDHTETEFRIHNLAVDPGHRRAGAGRLLVKELITGLGNSRRDRIVTDVRETNSGALLFYKALGFKALGVQRGLYPDTDEDGITMEYRLPRETTDGET